MSTLGNMLGSGSFKKAAPSTPPNGDSVFDDLLAACSMPVDSLSEQREKKEAKPAMSMAEALAFLQAKPSGKPPAPPDAAPPIPEQPSAPEEKPEKPHGIALQEGEHELFVPNETDHFSVELRGHAAAARGSHPGMNMMLTNRRLLWVNAATGKGTTVPLDKVKTQETGPDFVKLTLESGAVVTVSCAMNPENVAVISMHMQQVRDILLTARGIATRTADSLGSQAPVVGPGRVSGADAVKPPPTKTITGGKPIEKILGFVPQDGEREVFVPMEEQKFEVELRTPKAAIGSHLGIKMRLTSNRIIWVNHAAGGVTSVPHEKVKTQEFDYANPEQPSLTLTLESGMSVTIGCRSSPEHINRLNSQLLQARDSLAASKESGSSLVFKASAAPASEAATTYWQSYLARKKPRDPPKPSGDGKVGQRWAGIGALVSRAKADGDVAASRSGSEPAAPRSPSPEGDERNGKASEEEQPQKKKDQREKDGSDEQRDKKEDKRSRRDASGKKKRSKSRGRSRSGKGKRSRSKEQSRSRRRSDSRRKRKSRSRSRRRDKSKDRSRRSDSRRKRKSRSRKSGSCGREKAKRSKSRERRDDKRDSKRDRDRRAGVLGNSRSRD